MDTHTPPADRAVLHVVPERTATTQPMTEALLRTGRTVLTRGDLYQAMGALAGSQKATPIEAVFISAPTISHDDDEFFEMAPRAFPNLAIYIYGESAGSADRILQQSTAARIDAGAVESLFTKPSRPPPETESLGDAPVTKTEIAADPGSVDPVADAPSALEQRLLRSLDEDDALDPSPFPDLPPNHPEESHELDQSRFADVDHDAGAASDATPTELDDEEGRPPVPWNPSLARPARTPPGQDAVLEVVDNTEDQDVSTDDYAGRTDQSDADQPLLTREELDALLREEHDSSGGLEHRL